MVSRSTSRPTWITGRASSPAAWSIIRPSRSNSFSIRLRTWNRFGSRWRRPSARCSACGWSRHPYPREISLALDWGIPRPLSGARNDNWEGRLPRVVRHHLMSFRGLPKKAEESLRRDGFTEPRMNEATTRTPSEAPPVERSCQARPGAQSPPGCQARWPLAPARPGFAPPGAPMAQVPARARRT